jgi:uncharacterized hydrophobic protein (TIGR00271 family)
MTPGGGRIERDRLPEEGGDEYEDEPRLRGPWWFGRRPRALTEEQREHLLGQLFFEGPDRAPFLRRFAVLLAFSVLIAVFGLAEDSAPVVIGAMLISPLATPLLGLSAALVMGWPRRQLESLAILAAGTLGAFALAWVALLLVPEPRELTLQSEQLIARTEPRLLDLGIAIVAGAAGAYVLIRREAIGALPGVAIAVALVPPLSAVGMMVELGEPRLGEDALLLYLTNVAGIVLAGSLVLLFAGMRPETVRGRLPRRVRVGIAAAVVAVLAVAYPLVAVTRDRIDEATGRDTATELVREWLAAADQPLISIAVEPGAVHVEMAGPRRPPTIDLLAEALAAGLGEEVSLTADWIREHRLEAEAAP